MQACHNLSREQIGEIASTTDTSNDYRRLSRANILFNLRRRPPSHLRKVIEALLKTSRSTPLKHLVASGILTWDGAERRSDRYGSIHMVSEAPANALEPVFYDMDILRSLVGKRVHLTCHVVRTRDSEHAGDQHHDIVPVTPNVGEIVDLGVGIFEMNSGWDGLPNLSIRPNDGRRCFWFDPRLLYRLHAQSVEVWMEETEDAFSPVPEIVHTEERVSYDNGDGSVQVKNVRDGETVKLVPEFETLGTGMFKLDLTHEKGKKRTVL